MKREKISTNKGPVIFLGIGKKDGRKKKSIKS